jgi:hypothetical protein
LEALTDAFPHKSATLRYRTRTMGVPVPPVPGSYQVRVDYRPAGGDHWTRDAAAWPLLVALAEARPAVTH